VTKTDKSRNKHRGADDERDHAHRLGGRRHLANTGGPEDVAHPGFSVQVKGGKSVTTTIFRSGMDDAEEAYLRSGKPPLLAITDRSGTRLRRYVAMPEEVFAFLLLRCEHCDHVPVDHPRRWVDIVAGDLWSDPMSHLWTADPSHAAELRAEEAEREAEEQRRLAAMDDPRLTQGVDEE
jgi:hypothetical protein